MIRNVARRGGRSILAALSRGVGPSAVGSEAAVLAALPLASSGFDLPEWIARTPVPLRCLASKPKDADKDLISTLEAEIKHEESEEVELPRAPPNGFTVESQPGVAVMVWTRKIGAETIRVQSNVSEQEVFDDGFQEDEEAGDAVPSAQQSFVVEVGKEGSSRIIRFYCSTDGEEVDVQEVSLVSSDVEGDDDIAVPYDGPSFENLDTDLQGHLYSYLWSRGVDKDFVAHLFEATIHKEQAEYVKWLKDLKAFVESK